MKIAFFHNLPPGGAKRVVYYQIKGLSQKHSVDLYTIQSNEKDFLDFTELNCDTFEYPYHYLDAKFGKKIISDLQDFIQLRLLHKKIASVINEKDYDVIIVHPDRYTQAPYILRYLKGKSIYYCEELLRIAYENKFNFSSNLNTIKNQYEKVNIRIRKAIDKSNARSAQMILASSRHVQRNVQSAYNVPAKVCYLSVDTTIFSPHTPKKRKNHILFIGAPVAINGYDLITDALEMIPKKERPELNVINFFHAGKRLSDNELAKIYSESLVTVCLGRDEPFGLVPLESMACGTPVIALNEGGYKETVKDQETGYLVVPDPKQIAEKIIYLTNHPKIVKFMSKNAIEHVRKKWTWDKHISSLENFIKNEN